MSNTTTPSPSASERAERLLEPAVESIVHVVNSLRYRGEVGTGPMRDSYRWPLHGFDYEAIGKVALDFVIKHLPELRERITSEITAAEQAARREAINDAIDAIENHPRDFVGGELMTTSEFQDAVITTLQGLLPEPPSKETV